MLNLTLLSKFMINRNRCQKMEKTSLCISLIFVLRAIMLLSLCTGFSLAKTAAVYTTLERIEDFLTVICENVAWQSTVLKNNWRIE